MLSSTVLSSWLGGAGGSVVAPGLDPSALVEAAAPRRVLFVAADDASALLLAAATGAGLLTRTTAARARARLLEGTGAIVTSWDSLRTPSLGALLDGELAEAARVSWAAGEWEGALQVLASADGQADEVERVQGTGAVRRSPDLRRALVALGGGVLLGATPDGDSLGGVPVRHHSLGRPFPRGWLRAEESLRKREAGVDALGLLPAVTVVGATPMASPERASFVAGGRLLLVSDGVQVAPDVEASEVTAALGGLERGEAAGEPWLLARDAELELLRDLETVGALAGLRPTWTRARIADAKRFASPYVDGHPDWKQLADDYAAALAGWSLAERTELSLSDSEAARDLGALARALGVRPSRLADVLMDLVAADVIAARIESAGGVELEGQPGARFEDAAEALAADINSVRGARREAAAERARCIEDAECTTQGFRRAAGIEAGEPCGLCERCDPEGVALGAHEVTGASGSDASLEALFSGLGGGGEGRAAEPDLGEGLAARLASGQGGDGIEGLGGPELAAVIALFRHQRRDGSRELPPEAAGALLDALRLKGEGVEIPENVRELRAGIWEVRIENGTYAFARRQGTRGLAGKVCAAVGGQGAAAALAASWTRAIAAEKAVSRLNSYLGAGLDAEFDVPTLAARALEGIDEEARLGDSRDAQLLRAVAGLAATVPTPVPEGAPLVSVLMAWLRTDSVELLEQARPALQGKANALLHKVALRALAQAEVAAPIAAKELRRWLEAGEALPQPVALLPWVQAVWSGRRSDVAGLARLLPVELRPALIDAALRLDVLPGELLDETLAAAAEAEDPERAADALIAVSPDARRAKVLIVERGDTLGLHRFPKLMAALQPRKGNIAKALRSGLEARKEALRARQAERKAVVEIASEGRLGEAAERLSALLGQEEFSAAEQAELKEVRDRAVARQAELVAPIAAVLVGAGGEDAEDAAFAAIEDAVAEGFGKTVVALLSRQHRRTPGDPGRALWYARACCISGDWLEGERAYGVAAGLRSDAVTRVATEFEGIFMAFEEGEASRGLTWLSRALATPWHQLMLPQVTSLVDEGAVPAERLGDLAELLDRNGSPFYKKLVARLRG